VISVLVYGRNDAHGYNLHRRAALSFNCIAEVLTDPDDEIVFVDYNTPDELPTFVEALSDTLTERCLELLRVIRVPASIHEERFAERTHLPALEPVARNAAVRRANPANRWLLSTNTDMIFLPRSGRSLSEICAELADGFYGLPRYELPEWLWERLPRSDPAVALAEIARLGPALSLDEPTLSNEWIRFDAPGDFQLVLREDFVAIDGLDEEMILGYHVDSNFSKRMLLQRGSIESLESELAGYHCNHNRTPTVYHGAKTVSNDLRRFFLAVERPDLPTQRETWGLVGDELEEISPTERSGGRFAEAVLAAAPKRVGPRAPSDAARVSYELTYDTGHVLPFVADSLAVAPPHATIVYVGANSLLEQSLAALMAELDGGRSLAVADLDDPSSVDELARTADLFVVDLGLDLSLSPEPSAPATGYRPSPLPVELAWAYFALERLVELERARVELGAHPRRFVLVHSWTVFWDAYVLMHFDCSHMTAHSRVRRGIVRPVPIDDELVQALQLQERRLIRWVTREELGRHHVPLPPREPLQLAELTDYGGFGDGWSLPDAAGLWTQGEHSELVLALDGNDEGGCVLRLTLGSICVARGESLAVEALVNGEPVAARLFEYGDPHWHIELPAVPDGAADLTFRIEAPGSPLALGWSDEDERPLGILLRTVTLLPVGDPAAQAGLASERRLARWSARTHGAERRLHLQTGETVELTVLGDYGGFGDGWALDDGGIWTEGSESRIALSLDVLADRDYFIGISLGSIGTKSDETLAVTVLANGERIARCDFNYGDPEWEVELPAPLPADGKVDLMFEVERPRSPRELGWSDDDRPFGLLLRSLTLRGIDRSVRPGETIVFDETSGAERLLGTGWSKIEPTGVWTDGEHASLVLRLTDGVTDDVELVLRAAPFLTPEHSLLEVEASAGAEQPVTAVFRHGVEPPVLRVPLPPAVRGHEGRTVVDLELRDPARPADLGLGDDQRRLGIQLRWLLVRRRTWRAALSDAVRYSRATSIVRSRRR
jgi:hypothetical protein